MANANSECKQPEAKLVWEFILPLTPFLSCLFLKKVGELRWKL
jgi:hypothetical protein